MRILLVETDVSLARILTLNLRSATVQVDAVTTEDDALEFAGLYDYDAVLLGAVLLGIPGSEMIRRFRSARIELPILAIVEASDQQAKLKCFTHGADDVLAKPLDPQEVLARLQAVVRRAKGFCQPTLTVGPLTLNLAAHEVRVHGEPVHLTCKEYAVLELLTLRKGVALSKEVFLNHLYGGNDEPEAKIIDVFICKLRKKLAHVGGSNLISTVWGRGYMLRDPNVTSRCGHVADNGMGVPKIQQASA